ncbi:hypothetical protein ACRRTK_003349 [Alexandromys fortis]
MSRNQSEVASKSAGKFKRGSGEELGLGSLRLCSASRGECSGAGVAERLRPGMLRGGDGDGRWGPGPAERERWAAVRAAGPGAGSGKRGPEVGGKRAGLGAHPSEPASAGWELGGGGGPLAAAFLASFLPWA